jgi:DNA modification methylase
MRQLVRASLPLGGGIVLDPFMGAGSTIAASVAVGYESVGVESDPAFFDVAVKAVPALAALSVNGTTRVIKTNRAVSLAGRGRHRIGSSA